MNMRRTQSKLLQAYYGHPARDLKLICITGSTGKVETARLTHEILRAAGLKSACLASDRAIKPTMLHKFLSDAWKQRATYVVVTAEATNLSKDTFYGLPVHLAALTNFTPSKLTDLSTHDYLAAKSTLFKMHPRIVILNRDDAHYNDFAQFKGTDDTITYGQDRSAYVCITGSRLYPQGTEANFAIGTKTFTAASFLTGETAVSYMAAATAIATSLRVAPAAIIDGIANYDV